MIGCGVRPERSILDQFFSASRLRDTTVLQTLATVSFEPLQQGIIVEFEIVDVKVESETRKEVTIVAPVRLPDGTEASKRLAITLERGVLGGNDPERARRWIVTRIRALS